MDAVPCGVSTEMHVFAAESASLCLSMRNGDFMQQQHSMAKQHVTLMEANSARSLSCLSLPPKQAFLPTPRRAGAERGEGEDRHYLHPELHSADCACCCRWGTFTYDVRIEGSGLAGWLKSRR